MLLHLKSGGGESDNLPLLTHVHFFLVVGLGGGGGSSSSSGGGVVVVVVAVAAINTGPWQRKYSEGKPPLPFIKF